MSDLTGLEYDDHVQYPTPVWSQVPVDISCPDCSGVPILDGMTAAQIESSYMWVRSGRKPSCKACARTGRVPIPFSEVWGI